MNRAALTRLASMSVLAIGLSARAADLIGQTPIALRLEDAAGTWSTERNTAGMTDEMSLAWTPEGQPVVHLARNDFGAQREGTLAADQKDASVALDGSRLRGRVIVAVGASPAVVVWGQRQPVDIDLTFDRLQTRWVGTMIRDGVTDQVVFRRPLVRPELARQFEQLVGAWCASSNATSPQCLTISRELDVDSLLSQVYAKQKVLWSRRGNQIVLVTMDMDTSRLTFEQIVPTCCGNKFSGYLSDDGSQIEGRWIGGKTWSGAEPVIYVKTQ